MPLAFVIKILRKEVKLRKEFFMKRTALLVCAFIVAAAGPAFAMGALSSGGSQTSGRPQTSGRLQSSGSMRVGLAQKPAAADVGDIAEVEDWDVSQDLRRNPNTEKAQGYVYAEPAAALKEAPLPTLPPPVYAISGVKGLEIRDSERVDLVVVLPEPDRFARGLIEGEDVSNWVENLPQGLEALAHRVKVNDKSMRIYITGTPAVSSRGSVIVNIPGVYLESSQTRRFVSPTEEATQRVFEKSQTGSSD
jgi:hypothetical protein